MRCETVREALSARIDGEQEPIPGEAVDRHVESCPTCRSWLRSAEDLRRTMILQPAPEIPDLAGAIMEPRAARCGAAVSGVSPASR
ncbi:zf-HC2 domain-containing protein [Nocardia sp. NPDC088792]|uniref:zf-HC2 domain-containing protein n=1 Tax=Nocardia sp. NPDC088792 TaxID=3364332 RepID=UPI003824C06E